MILDLQTYEQFIYSFQQQFPNDPTLASNHPHHKHQPPNIKRNRVPAPGLSFTVENLSTLIREFEQNLLAPLSHGETQGN